MTRHQLRAARALLVLQQDVLAEKADVGVATVRRFENGNGVRQAIVDALQRVIEAEGAILVAQGTTLAGRRVGSGVLLRREAELPEETKRRLSTLDLTSEQASAGLPVVDRGKVGRRSRLPSPTTVLQRKKRDAAKDPSKA